MTERTTEDLILMKRRDLAALHTDELNAALFPLPVADDDISAVDKAAIRVDVIALVKQHRREVDAWSRANG